MAFKPCEFEEGEYRAPLFNQLHTSSLVWEPGQVFEQYIGIDHAMWTASRYLHCLFGFGSPLNGVSLSRYDFDYIWSKKKKKKKLPSFRLNVFIQAKRPVYGRFAPAALRALGLGSPYWRFEITPHQQAALEKLKATLGNRAIVCYACPAFHKESLLHKWTVEPRIVEKSSFPDVDFLAQHSAWNFSEPGGHGVVNVDPESRKGAPLLERIQSLVENNPVEAGQDHNDLMELSVAVRTVMNDEEGDASLRARFAEGRRHIQEIAEAILDREDPKISDTRALIAFGEVLLFCSLHRLNWLVAGRSRLTAVAVNADPI